MLVMVLDGGPVVVCLVPPNHHALLVRDRTLLSYPEGRRDRSSKQAFRSGGGRGGRPPES